MIQRSLPWITRDLKVLFRKRDRLHLKAKSSGSPSVWLAYKRLRNKAVSTLRQAKKCFLNTLSSSVRTPKHFWSLYHSLFPNRHRIPATLSYGNACAESTLSKCELFNNFFASVFSKSDPLDENFPPSSPQSPPILSHITCTEDEVFDLLMSLPRKTASGPDNISSPILRGTASAISTSLTRLFNSSLSLGQVPAEWKCSNVVPVFKRGDPKFATNYRPISLLSLPSKLLERIIHTRLMNHLLSNNLLSSKQFSFRPSSSTQEALISASSIWHQYLDKRLSVGAIFFDLSKAFDRVPHAKLLSALRSVGVGGSILAWFSDYLSNRTQQVVLDGCSSSPRKVLSGVPQGSILGPLLFIIYMDQLCSVPLSGSAKLQLYADDILLYKPLKDDRDVCELQSDIDSISNWVHQSGLLLNTSKTQLLIISRLRRRPTIHLTVGGVPIPESSSVKYLGVTLSRDLSWALHINNVSQKAKHQAGLIYIYRQFYHTSSACKAQLYKSLVLPTLDYCSSLWDPTYVSHVNLLKDVQKLSAKIITKKWDLIHTQNYQHLLSGLHLPTGERDKS